MPFCIICMTQMLRHMTTCAACMPTADKHEPDHKPAFNRGLVLKHNVNQRYATNAISATLFRHAMPPSMSPLSLLLWHHRPQLSLPHQPAELILMPKGPGDCVLCYLS